jgi:hypothetical protein
MRLMFDDAILGLPSTNAEGYFTYLEVGTIAY